MKNIGSNVKKNIKTTKEKEYKKYINFGKLQLKEPTFISNEDTFIDEMKKQLEAKFINGNEYVLDKIYDPKTEHLIDRKEKLSFKKITSSNDHFLVLFLVFLLQKMFLLIL